ncbi:MAG: sensor histidine kinase [Acetobacteraceae bacterium]
MRILDCLAALQCGRGARPQPLLAPRETGRAEVEHVRLAAGGMRAPALALLGHAQCLLRDPSNGATRAQAVATIASEILDLADDLEDRVCQTGQTRALAREPIEVGEVLGEVLEGVSAALAPGRRQFQVAPKLAGIGLEVDRRAFHQVLNRVLTGAARRTREGDCIEVTPEFGPSVFALVVADEGSSLVGGRGRTADRRGLGLGLALARTLMEAHGGSLAVESLTRIGTRVSLFFPQALVI